jgi:HxlR-like helix-turn-helix
VLRADPVESVLVFFTASAACWICAQDIHFVCLSQIVADLFKPNRRICSAFRPQTACALATKGNAGVLCFRCFVGWFETSNKVRPTIRRDVRRHIGDIQRNVRTVYPQVPPKVEYRLTKWGQALCPALDQLLKWIESRAASND